MEELHNSKAPETEEKEQKHVNVQKNGGLKEFIKKLMVPIVASFILWGFWKAIDLYYVNPKTTIEIKAYVNDKAGYPIEGALVSIVDKPITAKTNEKGAAILSVPVRMNDREVILNYEKDTYVSDEQSQPIHPQSSKKYDTFIQLNELGYFQEKFPSEIGNVLTLK